MADKQFVPQERGERFEIRSRLGSGGMGVVFEAFDRWRNEIVALKKLIQTDPAAIYRLKHEFRALADIAHPNLVSLYELVNQGEEWFFTMELVRGRSFLSYLQPVAGFGSGGAEEETVAGSDRLTRRTFSSDPKIASSNSDPIIAIPHSDSGPLPYEATLVQDDEHKPVTPQHHLTPDHVTPPPVVPPRAPESDCPVQIDVLRPALRQLAEGVAALHRAGKLHRDLKPSNVLVTPQGRVVILDFGLVSDVEPGRKLTFAGTPAYMSPEQLADQPATEASDWYAVGLMLYEALTGALPFGGDSPYAMLMEKQRGELTPPSSIVRGVPADLDRLCVDLLRRDPESRPDGQEVLRRLSKRSTDRLPTPKTASLDVPFVGRDRELQHIHSAYADARESPVVVLIHGRSGMGKSTLVRRFIDEARAKDRSIVVLTGRCYEQESVPYKALDSLVDDLTQYLRSLRPLEAKAMMPVNIGALTRLFPVLEGVEAARRERRKAIDVVDSQQLRRRAFAALREMMARIVDERPVVLFLDDLQWGDRDSAAAIAEILRPPDAPPLLLVAAYRREESETSPFVGELRKQREDRTLADVREIALDELGGDASRKLARALLGDKVPEQRVNAVAREAAGSPFFIHEIGRFATDDEEPVADTGGEDAPSSLDDLIRARVARLSTPAQDLLEVVALAGQPIEASIARDAARIPPDDLHAVVSTLRGAHLMRTRVRGGREEIVAYHDRIREAIVHRMTPPRKRAWHLRLANTLENVGWPDPELLAVHYQGAGETERAAVLALAAADKAAASLAFDHAARLYRLALELQGFENAPPRRVIQLADALGNAGHAFEAAQHYLRVAQRLEGHDALEMRRRAAELLLRSGRVDEGLAAFRDVLSSVGIKLPSSRKRALFGLLLRKIFQRLRGLRFNEREASAVPADLLLRVDVLWAALVGLSRTDILLAIYFQTKHLRLALRAGEPYRVARALALEAGFTSSGGGKAEPRTNFLLSRLFHYARKTDVPHAVGIAHLTAAIAAFLSGRFRDSAAEAQQADEIFRTRCTGVWWEMNTAQNYVLTSLAYLGKIEMLSQRVFAQLREAEERGDLYAITDMVGRVSIIWLAVDEPDGARRALRSAMSHWSTQSFHLQHIYALYTDAQIDIYNERPMEAWRFVQEQWPAFTSSKLLRIQMARIESACLHGRVALAAAAESGDETLIVHAENDARRILKEKMRWAVPLALMLEGGAAKLRGDTARARERFEQAVARLEKSEMLLHAAAARRRLGELTPGATGEALIHEADEWMRGQRVKRPEKMANVLAPM